MIRVLVVEDSITQREIIKRLLAASSQCAVAGEAGDGKQAARMVREVNPDVVLMDVNMPDMNGIEATRKIMAEAPVPIVILSSLLHQRDVDVTLEALEAGAVSVIAKPPGAALLHLHEVAEDLQRELVAASHTASILHRRGVDAPEDNRVAPVVDVPESVDIVGICVSTGGPPVLAEMLDALPKPFPLPVLLVQHISKGFEHGFAAWLSKRTEQTVRLVSDGDRLAPGVWLGPSGWHLTVRSPHRMALVKPEPADIHCPSGDPLFHSLAKQFGPKAIGIQLTGMGDDGAKGLLALRQSGAQTMIQEESTCAIWGMPKAAKEIAAAVHELRPLEIAECLARMAEAHREG
jgi:two-component system chemotaxis response regulator CheB